MTIKKGDNVLVTTGKEKGKTGTIVRVVAETGRVMIDGINVYKKFVRATRPGEKAQQVDRLRAMDASNVMLVCPSCKKATRVAYTIDGDTKTRVCKKCNAPI